VSELENERDCYKGSTSGQGRCRLNFLLHIAEGCISTLALVYGEFAAHSELKSKESKVATNRCSKGSRWRNLVKKFECLVLLHVADDYITVSVLTVLAV
jgi:hypothetical protein